jgi:hypothetical protein
MSDDKPHLTLVDPSFNREHELEFAPLPFYPWDERPETLPLDQDEAATAIYLARSELIEAAQLLKVPVIRLTRLIKHSPRLQRIFDENLNVALAHARRVPLRTLFDPNADQRALEWASTKILQSRLAIGDPLSPAPAASIQSNASLTVNQPAKTITFRWRTDADDLPSPNDDSA